MAFTEAKLTNFSQVFRAVAAVRETQTRSQIGMIAVFRNCDIVGS
jgi:hypothetical protein